MEIHEMRANKSQATRDGALSSASRFTLVGPACLSSELWTGPKHMNKGVLIIIWLILAFITAVGLGSLNIPTFWRLTKHASHCQGAVTEVTVDYHNTVRYQYTVNNRVYTGQTQTGMPNPEPGKLRPGDALIVFFDPDAPSTSVLEAPDALLKNEIISWGLAALVMPSLVVFGIKRGFVRNRRKAQPDG